MGRKFGDYIHLHWQNYYDHGTYRNKEKKNNYSAALMTAHYSQIKTAVQKKQIAPAQREKISTEYNRRNREAWNLFSSLVKDKVKNYNILTYLLSSINSQWTPEFIDEIIAGLRWDDTKNTFIYEPTLTGQHKKYKTSIAGWPALSLSAFGNFHYFATIRKYITVAEKYLRSLEEAGSLTCQGDLRSLSDMLQRLDKEEIVLKGWDKTERQIWQMTKNQTASSEQETFMKNVLYKLLNTYVQQLNEMRVKYVSAEEVNRQIQAALAEIFGNITAETSSGLAKEAIIEMIKSAISVGRTASSSSSMSSSSMISLSNIAITLAMKADPSVAKIVSPSGKSLDGKIKYSMSAVGQSRAQKRDVTLTIDAQDYGVSVKNTDLTNAFLLHDQKKNAGVSSTIATQNSSLLLYLMGMEKESPGIGTHYLNALSEHPDTSGLTTFQAQALYNIKLYTLYSSLTGLGQLRSSSGAAQILAIYDKAANSPSRVRLYDMSDIILAIEKTSFTEGVRFNPSLDGSFLFKNTKVDAIKTDSGGYRQPIEQRLTNVLLEARQKNIAVSLYTAWLRDGLASF